MDIQQIVEIQRIDERQIAVKLIQNRIDLMLTISKYQNFSFWKSQVWYHLLGPSYVFQYLQNLFVVRPYCQVFQMPESVFR